MLVHAERQSALWPPTGIFGGKGEAQYLPTTNSIVISRTMWQKPWILHAINRGPHDGDNNDGAVDRIADDEASAESNNDNDGIFSPYNFGSAGHLIAHEVFQTKKNKNGVN
jgi:hypothetical protein